MLKNKISTLHFLLPWWALVTWLSTSMLIDFVAIPTVFSKLKMIEGGVLLAGGIGVHVFSVYNGVELALAIILFAWAFKLKSDSPVALKALLAVLLIIGLSYVLYLTPSIRETFAIMNSGGDVATEVLERHSLFHRSYVFLDGIKIILLFISGGLLFAFQGRSQ